MSDEFAEWRPCRVCGLPVALPKRVHDECAEEAAEPYPQSLQVIHFTIHNPAAPNVPCFVAGCHASAEWAGIKVVAGIDAAVLRMAVCDRHFNLLGAADFHAAPVKRPDMPL